MPQQSAKDESQKRPSSEDAERRKRKIPSNLSGAALVEYKCRKKKKAWTKCLASFYESKFLPGEQLEQEGECDDLFERYRKCYMLGMLKVSGASPKENTALAEFMEEEGISREEIESSKKKNQSQ